MRLWCTGSGGIGLTEAAARRGMALPRLHAVLGTRLLAIADTGGVQRSPDHLVAEARQVLHAAAADEHDRVLLEVVALARDVRPDLHPVGEPDTRNLAQRRIRLLRRGRIDPRADAASLRGRNSLLASLAGLQSRRGELLLRGNTALADELAGGGHSAGRVAGVRRAAPGAALI